jgi:osmotically-inducible protein OsmY
MSEHLPYNSPADAQLRLQVLERLQHDPAIDASKIDVEVRDGTVILKGKSDTEAEKMLCEKVTVSIEGVKSVENQLMVEVGIAHALSSLAAHIQGDIIKDKDED